MKIREKNVDFATVAVSGILQSNMSTRRRKHRIPLNSENFLAAFEGFEGGFAIGAGILAGMSFADLDRGLLLTAAMIGIIVNGFNSASVKYSSEHYIDELDGREKSNKFRHYFLPALIQFLSYFAISLVSITPLFFIGDNHNAVLYSCIITVGILLIAGYWRASLLNMPRLRDGVELATLGAGIIFVGYVSGWIIHVILGA